MRTPTKSRTKTRQSLALLLLAASLPAKPAQAQRKDLGSMITDGVPDLPPAIMDRILQYQNIRNAAFHDWEPNGNGILVSTRFGETTQLHALAAPGGYRQQLTFFAEPTTTGTFDPKRGSSGFVFGMDVGGAEFFQYYWYDRQLGKPTLLTDGKSRNTALTMSPAGGRLAFSSTLRNGTDVDIYVMEGLDPKTLRRVKEASGEWVPLDWSPDESHLLIEHRISANESYLFVLDPSNGETREINPTGGKKKIAYHAARFARQGGSVYYASDEDNEFARLTRYDLQTGKKEILTPKLSWDVGSLALSLDGRWLVYTANEGGVTAVYLAATADPLKARRLDLPKGVVGGLKFDRESRRLGFTMSTPQTPADAYSVEVASGRLTRWTFSETGGLNPESFVAPELVQYPSFDGRKIPAWYYRARGAANKRVPVIISIHGGPEGQVEATFTSNAQYWVNELGAAVLLPNVRGSSGYGKTYLALDNGYKREDSVKDIGKLLDWIATRPELDKDRVAVIGGSYGGYMVLASMTHYSDRLRCGVDIVGVSNFVTMLKNTSAYRRDLRRVEYGDERDPKMYAFLQQIAPANHARNITKPLLVAQGQNDPRVPMTESEQIVRTVREGGGSVWYMLAKNEGHGFRKKSNVDRLSATETLFFEQFLLH